MKQKYEYKVVRLAATKKSIGTAKKPPTGDEAYEQVFTNTQRMVGDYAIPGRLPAWQRCGSI